MSFRPQVGIKLLAVIAGANLTAPAAAPWIPCPSIEGRLNITTTHTATEVGVWTLEYTDDQVNFETVTGASSLFTNPNGSNAGTYTVVVKDMPGVAWRLRYAHTSGSGNVSATAAQSDMI